MKNRKLIILVLFIVSIGFFDTKGSVVGQVGLKSLPLDSITMNHETGNLIRIDSQGKRWVKRVLKPEKMSCDYHPLTVVGPSAYLYRRLLAELGLRDHLESMSKNAKKRLIGFLTNNFNHFDCDEKDLLDPTCPSIVVEANPGFIASGDEQDFRGFDGVHYQHQDKSPLQSLQASREAEFITEQKEIRSNSVNSKHISQSYNSIKESKSPLSPESGIVTPVYPIPADLALKPGFAQDLYQTGYGFRLLKPNFNHLGFGPHSIGFNEEKKQSGMRKDLQSLQDVD